MHTVVLSESISEGQISQYCTNHESRHSEELYLPQVEPLAHCMSRRKALCLLLIHHLPCKTLLQSQGLSKKQGPSPMSPLHWSCTLLHLASLPEVLSHCRNHTAPQTIMDLLHAASQQTEGSQPRFRRVDQLLKTFQQFVEH